MSEILRQDRSPTGEISLGNDGFGEIGTYFNGPLITGYRVYSESDWPRR